MTEHVPLPRRNFATTRWSVVLAATGERSEQARSAFEVLLQAYWFPVYGFARRRGLDADEASDLTQGFFVRLLEKQDLRGADREKGKFRNFLLGAFQNYLANERDKARAQKRGGGKLVLGLDFAAAERRFSRQEPAAEAPERSFEREWAIALIEDTLRELETEWRRKGKSALFRSLSPFLTPRQSGVDAAQAAQKAGMSEGAFKVAAHRLRQEFRTTLRDKLAETVSKPEELEEEIRDLFRALEK